MRRWEHEAVLDAMQRRLDRKPDQMKVRRRTVEHIFGTLSTGWNRPIPEQNAGQAARDGLHVLAYNLKRVTENSASREREKHKDGGNEAHLRFTEHLEPCQGQATDEEAENARNAQRHQIILPW